MRLVILNLILVNAWHDYECMNGQRIAGFYRCDGYKD